MPMFQKEMLENEFINLWDHLLYNKIIELYKVFYALLINAFEVNRLFFL